MRASPNLLNTDYNLAAVCCHSEILKNVLFMNDSPSQPENFGIKCVDGCSHNDQKSKGTQIEIVAKIKHTEYSTDVGVKSKLANKFK